MCRRARSWVTSWSARGRGGLRFPATRRRFTSPTASATTSPSSTPQAARRRYRCRSAASPTGSWSMSKLRRSALVFLVLFAGAIASAGAQSPSPPPPRQQVKIGFVEIENDARYEPLRAYERIILKSREHPLTGAEVGVDEAAAFARVLP